MASNTLTFAKTDLSRFKNQQVRAVIETAMHLGWMVKWQNRKHLVAQLFSPGGEKVINVPQSNVNQNRIEQWARQLVRYSPQVDIDKLMLGNAVGMAEKIIAEERAKPRTEYVVDTKRGEVIDVHPEPEPEPEPALVDEEDARTIRKSNDDDAAPHVGHWVRSDGTVSDTVLTHLTDGQRYYQCAVCGYESTVSGASVAIHARRHRPAQRFEGVDEDLAMPEAISSPATPEQMMRPTGVDDIARSIEALITQRVEAETSSLREQVRTLVAQRDHEHERAEAYKSDLAALKEILGGVRL